MPIRRSPAGLSVVICDLCGSFPLVSLCFLCGLLLGFCGGYAVGRRARAYTRRLSTAKFYRRKQSEWREAAGIVVVFFTRFDQVGLAWGRRRRGSVATGIQPFHDQPHTMGSYGVYDERRLANISGPRLCRAAVERNPSSAGFSSGAGDR